MNRETAEKIVNELVELGFGKNDQKVSIGFERWTKTTKLQRNLLWRMFELNTQKVIEALQTKTVKEILQNA